MNNHFTPEERRALLGEVPGPQITITHEVPGPGYIVSVWMPGGSGMKPCAWAPCSTIAEANTQARFFRRRFGRRLPVLFDGKALTDFLAHRRRQCGADMTRINAGIARKMPLTMVQKRHAREFMKLRYSYRLSANEQREAEINRQLARCEVRSKP